MDASTDSPNSETAARLTPMMAQYLEIKAVNPGCLLFYRMGDFYELFFEDAEIASRALGIVLTKRGKHEGEDIRMCGVPVERADDYLNRLIALGHRVAVCQQMEEPAAAKKRDRSRSSSATSCGWSRPARSPRSGCWNPDGRVFWWPSRKCVRAKESRCTASRRSICRRGRLRSAKRTNRPCGGDRAA